MKIKSILSTEDFINTIEKICKNDDIGYIDAIVHYCEVNDIEIETAAGMVKSSRPLKFKLETEASELKMLKASLSGKLPI